MGSLITHYGLTKSLSEKYGFSDKTLYGAILPDILGLTGIKSKEVSHYMDGVIDVPHFDRYIDLITKNGCSPIELGYLFHLIQDNVWYKILIRLESTFNGTHEEFRDTIHSDMNITDRILLDKMNIDEKSFAEIKTKLIDLSENEVIKQGIEKCFRIREIKTDGMFLITEEIYSTYLQDAIEECEKYYKQIFTISP